MFVLYNFGHPVHMMLGREQFLAFYLAGGFVNPAMILF